MMTAREALEALFIKIQNENNANPQVKKWLEEIERWRLE